ncbi:MAG: flagellar protein FlgN [Proteobacteria bacterium]|nr:flagellar protein FlgN [Pseudomonadota bacterium]
MPASDTGPLARIEEEIEAAQTLLLLVESEQQMLLGVVDADELNGITAKKTEAVIRVGGLARFRHDCLSRSGYRPDEAGMRDWLPNLSDPSGLDRWESLLSIARKVKTLNQTNGQLVAKRLGQNQTLLGVFGMATQGLGLYGADGRPQGARTGYLR